MDTPGHSPDLSPAPTGELTDFLGAADVRLAMPVATLGARMAAQWLDLALLSVGLAAVWAGTLGAMAGAAVADDSLVPWILAAGVLATALLQWGYFFAFELAWRGQTPGKRALGLRVVTLEGTPPGAVACMVRNLLRLLDALPGPYGVGVLAVYLGGGAQRLGDMAAGTVVVRDLPPPAGDPVAVPGLGPAELALLERWQVRAPTLLPEHRQRLATALVARLRVRRPGLDDEAPEQALARLARGEG
ncbi:RDD family protein [Myxococcota bacterium]|nr:RDD family protein [Myxococcota bacterium]